MSTLHIVRTSAFSDNALQKCIYLLDRNDQLLLLDDGVYNCHHPLLANINNSIFALKIHCTARSTTVNNHISLIDMCEFVALTDNAEKVITWQ